MYPRNHKKWEPLWETVHLRGVRQWIWEIWNFNRKVGRKSYGIIFEEVKKVETSLFFGQFCAHFDCVAHIPFIRFWCLFARGGPFGCRITLQYFMKIVWNVSEKIDIFIEKSGEKNDSRNFFRLPKIRKSPKLAVLLPITFFSTNRERLTWVYPRSVNVVEAFTRKSKVCRKDHVMYPRNHKKWEPLWETVHLRGIRQWIWEIWNFNRKIGRKSYGRVFEEVKKSRNKSVFWPILCSFRLRCSHPIHTIFMSFHTLGTLWV